MPVPVLSFQFSRDGVDRTAPVLPRGDVAEEAMQELLHSLSQVPWTRLHHAYGPADDVPAQLYAIHVGITDVRRAAWSEVWGSIHHQGTVYAGVELPARDRPR